jgi:hypothetical protein
MPRITCAHVEIVFEIDNTLAKGAGLSVLKTRFCVADKIHLRLLWLVCRKKLFCAISIEIDLKTAACKPLDNLEGDFIYHQNAIDDSLRLIYEK